MPATVGGSTIGASTKGLTKLVNFPELFAKIHASGTPRIRDNRAARVDVHNDSFIAVKSDIELKKELQGTFASKATKGAIITKLAITARLLTTFPNFTLLQTLCSVTA
jgi:hypothetical protein